MDLYLSDPGTVSGDLEYFDDLLRSPPVDLSCDLFSWEEPEGDLDKGLRGLLDLEILESLSLELEEEDSLLRVLVFFFPFSLDMEESEELELDDDELEDDLVLPRFFLFDLDIDLAGF